MRIAPVITRAASRRRGETRSPTRTGTRKSAMVMPFSVAGTRVRDGIADMGLLAGPARRKPASPGVYQPAPPAWQTRVSLPTERTMNRSLGHATSTRGHAGGRSAFPPIRDYGFLSDCEVTALVAPSGNVEWLCVPRLDGPSVFGAILDRDAGNFR